MTDRQKEGWNKDKPRRDYLKSIKDTLDEYINTKLDSIQEVLDNKDYGCYGFNLNFNKRGKLIKIWDNSVDINIWDGLSFYFEDRIEAFKCKKLVKKIFKKIDLNRFDLKYEFNRTFYFDLGNGWTIVDDTIY